MDTSHDYPVSEFAKIFPAMSDADYAALVQSIGEVGQLESISLWRGEILDGQHRYRACREAGVEPKFEFLPDDTDPLKFVVGKNLARRQLTTGDKAVAAYKSYLAVASEPATPGEGSFANSQHRTQLTQKEAAKLFGVSLRSFAHAKAVLAPDSTAAPELQRAVEQGLVAVSAAAGIVKTPQAVQKEALERVSAGKSKSLAGAVQEIALESVRDEAPMPHPGRSITPPHPPVFHPCAVGDLDKHVEEGSVDVIATHPPLYERSLPLYSGLADFALHALKEDGVMAVMVTGHLLPSIMDMLKRPGLHWVCEADVQFDRPEHVRHQLHQLTLYRRPLLVYGKRGFRWSGSDVIRLPSPDGPSIGGATLWEHDAAMALVVARFTQPGQVVCDPFLLGRGGTAVGALDKGCRFIGADPSGPAIEKTKKYLEKAGLGGGLEHGTSPTLF